MHASAYTRPISRKHPVQTAGPEQPNGAGAGTVRECGNHGNSTRAGRQYADTGTKCFLFLLFILFLFVFSFLSFLFYFIFIVLFPCFYLFFLFLFLLVFYVFHFYFISFPILIPSYFNFTFYFLFSFGFIFYCSSLLLFILLFSF
jgi:hypothetical protein